jgi:hypothetical protein
MIVHVHPHRVRILAESEPGAPDGLPTRRPREPRRRHEADRLEAKAPQQSEPALDPLGGTGFVERQELAFSRRATPRAPRIAPPSCKSLLVVPLTM